MTIEKWQDIINNIKDSFKVENEGKMSLEEEGGMDIEYIEFIGPLGKMRLEFISKPIVVDKKTIYSKRIGSETKVDYIYSQNEKSQQLAAYKWDEEQNDWLEMEAGNFA